jgi:hypothetical protein
MSRRCPAAWVGELRPLLWYKTAQQGGRLLVADLKLSQQVWACEAPEDHPRACFKSHSHSLIVATCTVAW